MIIQSINPYNNKIIFSIEEDSVEVIESKLKQSAKAFESWKKTSTKTRDILLTKVADLLVERKEELAKLIAQEVGQPIKSAVSEIEKSALAIRFYEGKLKKLLKNEKVKTESTESYVKFEPLGVILGIAPWNFPFWMALRFIIPTIAAGNAVVLKHSSNVTQCALAIEKIFIDAGFPQGVVQLLIAKADKIEAVINNPIIKGVSFSGSDTTGSIVASLAGKAIKKSLLELGGNDAFIVLEDADIATTAKTLAEARLRNAGQACNSPKRVFVHNSIEDKFITELKSCIKNIKLGDPMDLTTEIGPLATKIGLAEVKDLLSQSVKKGANIVLGGKEIESDGNLFEPTIVNNVKPGMSLFNSEVFGPIIAITSFDSMNKVIKLVNQSKYGLGASIWSKDIKLAKKFINKLEVGNVFINQPVRSDVRLPYGGVKNSGYGRELSYFGLKEFTNIKTVVIK